MTLIGSTVVGGSAAARLGATSTNSVEMIRLNGATGDPVFGERITFRISTSISNPFVLNRCWKNDVVVYSELHGFSDSNSLWGTTYTLGPTSMWQKGAANCVASLLDSDPQADEGPRDDGLPRRRLLNLPRAREEGRPFGPALSFPPSGESLRPTSASASRRRYSPGSPSPCPGSRSRT